MNLTKPEVSFFSEKVENDYIKKIEHCARICYKSEDKIDLEYHVDQSKQMNDDDKKRANEMRDEMVALNRSMQFLGSLIARGHTSVLEHYRPIYRVNEVLGQRLLMAKQIYNLKYIEVTPTTSNRLNEYEDILDANRGGYEDDDYYVSGNLRAFYDIKDIAIKDKYLKIFYHKLSEDFELLFQDQYIYKSNVQDSKMRKFFKWFMKKIYDEQYYITKIKSQSINDKLIRSIHEAITVKIVSNRGFTHEAVRHRISSISQESSRYCNYSKDKFGKQLTFIDPQTTIDRIINGNKEYPTKKLMQLNKDDIFNTIINFYEEANKTYMDLMTMGCMPDLARLVLPIGIKTEIVMTMTAKEWRDSFFSLRLTDNVHPDMLNISRPLLNKFKEKYEPLFKDINY